MLIDWIAWGICGLAVVTVAVVIGRKIPMVRAIDVTVQPGEKARQVKARLMEHRLNRKMVRFREFMSVYGKPLVKGSKESVSRIVTSLTELNKRYERQLKELENENDPGDRTAKVRQLLEEAITFSDQQAWSEAEQRLIEAVSLDPKNLEAYHRLGDIYLEQKNYEDARQTFEYLIKLNQADDTAYSGLAHIAEAEGRFGDARDEYLHSIKLNATAAQHHFDLSKVYSEMGQPEEALTASREAVRLEPNNPKMLSGLLELQIKGKDGASAKATLDRLREANPENQKLDEWQELIDKL